MGPIYLDNAATSFPKPPAVAAAMARYLTEVGASINRGVYASAQDAGMTTLLLREGLCRLFHHGDPTHCVLTAGNTMGLNMVRRGALRPGDHCLVSAMEHNGVMRPLRELAERAIQKTRDFFASLGLPATLSELGIGPEYFPEMARKARTAGFDKTFVPLSAEDIVRIYQMSL